MNVWDMFFQMIVGKELARHLEKLDVATPDGMTLQVLSAVLIADAWFRGSKIDLKDWAVDFAPFKNGPSCPGDEEAAEILTSEAENAAVQGRHTGAVGCTPCRLQRTRERQRRFWDAASRLRSSGT